MIYSRHICAQLSYVTCTERTRLYFYYTIGM